MSSNKTMQAVYSGGWVGSALAKNLQDGVENQILEIKEVLIKYS